MEFNEITDGFPVTLGSFPLDLQICNDHGQAIIYGMSVESRWAVLTGVEYAMATSEFVRVDCTVGLFNYFKYSVGDTRMYINDTSAAYAMYFDVDSKTVASAGNKVYPLLVGSGPARFFAFDSTFFPFLEMETSGSTVYGVISTRSEVSAAFVEIDGTLAKVSFRGFDSSNYGNDKTGVPVEYPTKNFNFTVSITPTGMRFAEYHNILYYAYQNNFDETFIQAIPSAHNGAYKIGGSGNKLNNYNMVGMGKDNSTLLLAYIYLTGEVWIGLWDSTATVGFAAKDLGLRVDVIKLKNEPIGLFRVNDSHAELYIASGSVVSKYVLNVVGDNSTGPTYEDVIVVDVLVVNASTIVENLTLSGNSTLVLNEGAVITVKGCATLNGTLVIVLSNGTIQQVVNNNGTVNLLVMEVACRNGDFNEIQIQGDLPDCYEWSTDPSYSPTQLTLVISTQNDCEIDTMDYTGLIIGVVIGGAVLVVGILLLSFYFSPLREKVFPYARKG